MIHKMSLADWQAVIDVNLSGVFYCLQAVGRHLMARAEAGENARRIVNVLSVAGRAPPNANLLQQVRDGRQPFGLGFPALWGDPGSFARQLLVDVREHQGGDAGTRGSVAIAIDGRDERAQAA